MVKDEISSSLYSGVLSPVRFLVILVSFKPADLLFSIYLVLFWFNVFVLFVDVLFPNIFGSFGFACLIICFILIFIFIEKKD